MSMLKESLGASMQRPSSRKIIMGIDSLGASMQCPPSHNIIMGIGPYGPFLSRKQGRIHADHLWQMHLQSLALHTISAQLYTQSNECMPVHMDTCPHAHRCSRLDL